MKIWRLAFAMLAVLSLASCSNSDDEEVNGPTEAEKASDLYEVADASFAVGSPDSIITCHLDTTYIYNYSYSDVKPVTYTMFDNLNDTLSITITEGHDYVNRLRLQGPIQFPSSIVNGTPTFSVSKPIAMPIIQPQAVVGSNIRYTASTTLAPRTFLKYTGTYHCIVSNFTFTAYYRGQNTGETICVKGRFRHSQPTIYPINDTPSSYSVVGPIE